MYSQGIKGPGRIKSRIRELIAWTDREICMEPDEFAYHVGWTVTRTGFGARRYRDPRFDQLRVPGKVREEVT
ncbi:hypothetical protein SAMN05421811_117154 [Nonomuraea wenchangensis]|uniref:Uncharacterized protein n=1 Tax=Nonomuraea wenchangensis TaxID=568860 RepID=A0A1I0LIE0_9ACTN|nr:hypothetical protein SAMN05421811_117154 [Nonomuraea wenchangensis]